MKPRNLLVVAWFAAALLLSAWSGARASFDGFLPVGMVIHEADVIALLEFTGVNAKGVATAKVQKVLKGKLDDKELKIDLIAGPIEAQGKAVAEVIKGGQKQGLLLVGSFAGDDGGEPQQIAFLHMACAANANLEWLRLSKVKGNEWDLDRLDLYMLWFWAGGTDMLLRCVEYVLSDAEPYVPAEEGVEWDKEIQVGKIEGRVFAAEAVDLAGKGRNELFVACEKGDRFYRWNGKAFDDVTAACELTSKSAEFTWGDFDGDGRVDLASWDAQKLTLHRQKEDGKFTATACDTGDALKNGCLGLATVDCGRKGRPALVAATKGSPVVLTFEPDDKVQARPVASGELPAKDFGEAGKCLVEDFDGNALPDVLQFFTRGGLFYKGKAAGEFAAPVPAPVVAGEGRHALCAGDFDGDGLLEVFGSAQDKNHLWQNLGGGRFVEAFDLSGELRYHPKPGGVAVQAADFNNDGLQDLLTAYGQSYAPILFFNRGFRSFIYAYGLDLVERKVLPQAHGGQQAACLGDFNADAALDMALALPNGEVWVVPRKVEKDQPALALLVSLSTGAPTAGPVNVLVYKGARLLGTWSIRAGSPAALIGARQLGPIRLKWTFPGGKPQEKQVIVKDKAVIVALDAK